MARKALNKDRRAAGAARFEAGAERGAGRRASADPESFMPRVPGVDYGVLDELLGYAIRRAQIKVYAHFFKSIGDQTTTPQRFTVLSIIGSNPGLQQTQIANIMGVARPGATALIDYWERRDCVERRRDPGDRRSYGIYVTDCGQRLLAALRERVRGHDAAVAAHLSASEVKHLMALLNKLYFAPGEAPDRDL